MAVPFERRYSIDVFQSGPAYWPHEGASWRMSRSTDRVCQTGVPGSSFLATAGM